MLIRPAQNEMYLLWVSYAILLTFLLLELLLSYWNDTRLVMAPAMLFTYITYSLLPVRLQQAVTAGIILSATQLLAAFFLDKTLTMESESVSRFLLCILSVRCRYVINRVTYLMESLFCQLYSNLNDRQRFLNE